MNVRLQKYGGLRHWGVMLKETTIESQKYIFWTFNHKFKSEDNDALQKIIKIVTCKYI